MYDAVLPRFGLCAVVMLGGCTLIGYDLSPQSDADAALPNDGGNEREANDAGGAQGNAGTRGGGGGEGGPAAGAGGGADAALPAAGSGGDTDAAIDGGAAGDAGLGPDPCPDEADGTPCDINAFCRIDMRCSGGVCAGGTPRDCSEFDLECKQGVCNEAGRTCEPRPLADGTTCGAGRTCHEGVCRGGQVCGPGQTCNQVCAGGACYFDCNAANTCTIACDVGSDCDIDCQGANNCQPTCATAVCDIDCRDGNNCDAFCFNSDCRIRCENTESCDAIVCGPGASCVIECGGSDCGFEVCSTNDVQQCPDDVLVCNAQCP